MFVTVLANCACSTLRAKIKSDAAKFVRRVTLTPDPVNLKVGIDSVANDNSAIAVNVVLIRDKNFWKTAPDMVAKDWFAKKIDLQRRYGKNLIVNEWEWVPGQSIDPINLKVPRGVYGAMVFADYQSPGTHSAPVPRGVTVAVCLQAEDFTLEPSSDKPCL